MTPTTKSRASSSLDIGAVRGKVASNPNLDPDLINKRMEEAAAETEAAKPSFSVPKELKGLEDLIFLGAGTKDVTLGDFTFQLATLSSKEQERIFKGSLLIPEDERLFFFKKRLLATAIKKINNRPLSSYLDADTYEARVLLIDGLQNIVFEHLFKGLETLISEMSDVLTAENLKK
jgi:hypothetical protein